MGGEQVELVCRACGSNRLQFPSSDDEKLTCEDCGASLQSLGSAKAQIGGLGTQTSLQRADSRRKRQVAEIEAGQVAMRKSITETERLVTESDKMVRRHHKECDDDTP